MSVKQRLTEFVKREGLTNSAFCRSIGVSNAFISSMVVSAQPDKIERIALNYPHLNTGWLLTGEGEMIKGQTASRPEEPYKLVPVYNFDAVGGLGGSNEVTDTPAYIERYVPFIGARKDDISIHVTGNSMAPTHCPGSLLLVREVRDWKEYFGYGHCFVIFLNDGRRILKEVQRYAKNPEEYVLCVSHNKEFPEEELPKRMVTAVYKVIMTLTNEGF